MPDGSGHANGGGNAEGCGIGREQDGPAWPCDEEKEERDRKAWLARRAFSGCGHASGDGIGCGHAPGGGGPNDDGHGAPVDMAPAGSMMADSPTLWSRGIGIEDPDGRGDFDVE